MRYLPLTNSERQKMLEKIGKDSTVDLFSSIPSHSLFKTKLPIGSPMSERKILDYMEELSFKNKTFKNIKAFLGAGAYNHYIPTAISQLLSRSEFYTSYTPYQAEVSQGTLQAIYEFQTLISQLFAMDVSNASMYDGASSMAEAVLMSKRINRKAKKVLLSSVIHPEYLQTTNTYIENKNFIELLNSKEGLTDLEDLENKINNETSAVVVQYPNFLGNIEDLEKIKQIIDKKSPKTLFIVVVAEPFALGAITPPGDFGADIVVGEGQSLGIPVSFGGPGIGLFSCKREYLRKMPGRIAGQTVDATGRRSFVFTLSTREQHIRRDKATSNICSNHSLNAVAVSIYLSLMGKEGLKEISLENIYNTQYAIKALSSIENLNIKYGNKVFNEFVVEVTNVDAIALYENLKQKGILFGLHLKNNSAGLTNCFLLNFTENIVTKDIDHLVSTLIQVMGEL